MVAHNFWKMAAGQVTINWHHVLTHISLVTFSSLEQLHLSEKQRMAREYFTWTNDESELLLCVMLEYKMEKSLQNINWESLRSKYDDIHERFVAHLVSIAEGEIQIFDKEYPHHPEEVSRAVVASKLKGLRLRYRKAVDTGRRSGQGRVVELYYNLCQEIWGGSPATEQLSSGLESGDLMEDGPIEVNIEDLEEGDPNVEDLEEGDPYADDLEEEDPTAAGLTSQEEASANSSTNLRSSVSTEKAVQPLKKTTVTQPGKTTATKLGKTTVTQPGKTTATRLGKTTVTQPGKTTATRLGKTTTTQLGKTTVTQPGKTTATQLGKKTSNADTPGPSPCSSVESDETAKRRKLVDSKLSNYKQKNLRKKLPAPDFVAEEREFKKKMLQQLEDSERTFHNKQFEFKKLVGCLRPWKLESLGNRRY